MTIHCMAIDDEPLALRQLVDFIRKTPFLSLEGECSNAFDAIEVLHKKKVDLMFVDINMPGLSGMDFVKSLDNRPEVIFITAYGEFAIEGFKVDALDYLLKPIGYNDFLKAANKALSYFESQSKVGKLPQEDSDFLFVKSEYRLVRIRLTDIRYIESMREYVRIYLLNSKPVMSLMSMKLLEEKLPAHHFMRVHRSFIVNLRQITTIERGRIVFDKDIYIPVGEQYKDQFQKFVDGHFL